MSDNTAQTFQCSVWTRPKRGPAITYDAMFNLRFCACVEFFHASFWKFADLLANKYPKGILGGLCAALAPDVKGDVGPKDGGSKDREHRELWHNVAHLISIFF